MVRSAYIRTQTGTNDVGADVLVKEDGDQIAHDYDFFVEFARPDGTKGECRLHYAATVKIAEEVMQRYGVSEEQISINGRTVSYYRERASAEDSTQPS